MKKYTVKKYVLDCKNIETAISRAIKELQKQEIHENFGQEYCMAIADKFVDSVAIWDLEPNKRNQLYNQLHGFQRWCETYNGTPKDDMQVERKSQICLVEYCSKTIKYAIRIVYLTELNNMKKSNITILNSEKLVAEKEMLDKMAQIQLFCNTNIISCYTKETLGAYSIGKYGTVGYGLIIDNNSKLKQPKII